MKKGIQIAEIVLALSMLTGIILHYLGMEIGGQILIIVVLCLLPFYPILGFTLFKKPETPKLGIVLAIFAGLAIFFNGTGALFGMLKWDGFDVMYSSTILMSFMFLGIGMFITGFKIPFSKNQAFYVPILTRFGLSLLFLILGYEVLG